MASSNKTASKNTDTKKADEGTVEARPQHQGKDPLAEGNTLVNPTNSEAETHYDVKERSEDVQKADNTINGQDANQRAEQHNAEAADAPVNSDEAEQAEVAEGRTEETANK